MPTAAPEGSPDERRDALSARLFESFVAGAEMLTVELGRRLNLYRVVHDHGPVTAGELATGAGIAPRYAVEWLEQQAAAGFLDVAADTGDAGTRRFALPDAHVPVLLDADHPANTVAFAPFLTGLALTLPDVATAYRSGTGVSYDRFGAEVRLGIGLGNRPMFSSGLPDWLATVPDIAGRLQRGGSVLDLGCGAGWSSVVLARTFPAARVDGIDMDSGSIAEARITAADQGVADRVRFVVGNASDVTGLSQSAGPSHAAGSSHAEGGYDLVAIFEALHDMGDPVGALTAARTALAPGGAVLVADERVADSFTAPAGAVDRLMYAVSVLHCLPATMAESTGTVNGTVLRSATVRAWAAQAGFTVTELPVDNPVWRFYRLDPAS